MSPIKAVCAAAIFAACVTGPVLIGQPAGAQEQPPEATPTPVQPTPEEIRQQDEWQDEMDRLRRKSRMARLRSELRQHRKMTWHWQDTAFKRRTPASSRSGHTSRLPRLQDNVRVWRMRKIRAKRTAMNPPHNAQWNCIHFYERDRRFRAGSDAAWATNTGNGYYGGLQMDWDFMATYGGRLLRIKGPANNWTDVEQKWVAEQARKTRGYTPWPNTARFCGLL